MKKFLLLVVLLCVAAPVSALEIGGVELPETVTVDGRTLQLNGVGLRTRFFFKIYAGGLYLEAPSHDAAAVIATDEPMLVRMHFIYDGVSAEKLQEGWKAGFHITTPDPGEDLQAAMDAFTGFFNDQVKKNDVYDIAWQPGRGIEVVFNGNVQGQVSGLDFKKALFAIWFGPDPVDTDLKEGMLGR